MRVRGLKPLAGVGKMPSLLVAPHAGAWIETQVLSAPGSQSTVAPHAGAWIETKTRIILKRVLNCRTPCGCVD